MPASVHVFFFFSNANLGMLTLPAPEFVPVSLLIIDMVAGLGETIPLLNGVVSLTNEATSLNNTAASINNLVASGNHIVSEIETKGIAVRGSPDEQLQ